MPLVVICGMPSSGKSTRVRELVEFFKSSTDKDVHVVPENFSTAEAKNACYLSSRDEKEFRSTLKSEVERILSPEKIVILDALNYIKGYRYELYCISKHLKTTHCILLCDVAVEVAKEWNARGEHHQRYTDEVFDALVMRFETPDARNRWDYPLLTVHPDDPLPSKDLIDALLSRKPPPPNQSTQSKPLTPASFLHDLDQQTQEVMKNVLAAQQTGEAGSLKIPGSSECLHLTRVVTMTELRTARRQFISYTSLHPVEGHMISTLFVQYLNNTLI